MVPGGVCQLLSLKNKFFIRGYIFIKILGFVLEEGRCRALKSSVSQGSGSNQETNYGNPHQRKEKNSSYVNVGSRIAIQSIFNTFLVMNDIFRYQLK
jgi:hypothetical protein